MVANLQYNNIMFFLIFAVFDLLLVMWLGFRVVSVLNSGAEGPGSNCSREAGG